MCLAKWGNSGSCQILCDTVLPVGQLTRWGDYISFSSLEIHCSLVDSCKLVWRAAQLLIYPRSIGESYLPLLSIQLWERDTSHLPRRSAKSTLVTSGEKNISVRWYSTFLCIDPWTWGVSSRILSSEDS
jgi:hypothetical protein